MVLSCMVRCAGEFGADLADVGMLDVLAGSQRLLPSIPCLSQLAGSVAGVAEAGEGVSFKDAVAVFPGHAERALVAGGGFGQVAQMVFGEPQAVPDTSLDPAVPGFCASGNCPSAEHTGLRLILPGHGLTPAHGYPLRSLANGPYSRAAPGSVLCLSLIGLLGLGIATAVRDSAAAIGVILGLLYLFPVVAAAVSNQQWQRHLEQISPVRRTGHLGDNRAARHAHQPVGGPRRARRLGHRRATARRTAASPAGRISPPQRQAGVYWRPSGAAACSGSAQRLGEPLVSRLRWSSGARQRVCQPIPGLAGQLRAQRMAPGYVGLAPPRLGGAREPFCRGGRYRPVSSARARAESKIGPEPGARQHPAER